MPDLATSLKAEISRLARKELKTEVASLKKAVATYRSDIAALKKRATELERQLRRGVRAGAKASSTAELEASGKRTRFSAKSLAAQRRRLGLSAADMGTLLGASGQSVYNWEAGTARPRAKHLAFIASLRGTSKKDVARLLTEPR